MIHNRMNELMDGRTDRRGPGAHAKRRVRNVNAKPNRAAANGGGQTDKEADRQAGWLADRRQSSTNMRNQVGSRFQVTGSRP